MPTLELQTGTMPSTLSDLKKYLIAQYPHMEAHFKSAIFAVNQEYAFDSDTLNDGDEIAIFPPVSGGDETTPVFPEITRLAEHPFSTDELINAITTEKTGAVCVFSGMVRGETQRTDRSALAQTDHLFYEAYETMAVAKMRQVIAEIRVQFPLVQGVAIVQRVGRLEVGQNTIVIACASSHRDEGCFEAARYGIDRLKEIVPVWKKEIGIQGEAWVEGHYYPNEDDRPPVAN